METKGKARNKLIELGDQINNFLMMAMNDGLDIGS
jgi:hypothetical protein